ncbi:unnamed protein product [Adineta steineri]|uniref:Uncharacterized protein n=1 Tax=Adineta steineri TaxID=433720 RepID=A0A820G184_9BILA|nr:unnamed protein product [Adineta steineri]
MKEVEHKNILLTGRTRTGKSTIKSLLVNPTNVPNELTLKSGTKESRCQSFHLQEDDVVLNITDTSGLFEHNKKELEIRCNEMILKTIGFALIWKSRSFMRSVSVFPLQLTSIKKIFRHSVY